MFFKQIFDKKLAQYAYLIGCQRTGEAIIVDPLRDVDQYHRLASKENLTITAAADTHIHADYISGLRELAEEGIKIHASGEGDEEWQYEWLQGSDYEYDLLSDGDVFGIGNITFEVVHTPGHTPESLSYLVTDGAAANEPMGILTGDFVFVGDVGRPDLLETAVGQQGAMKPSAQKLYKSVEKFKYLPEYLQVWPGHGAGSACGKALGAVPETTVGYELRFSPAFEASATEDSFIDYILEGQPDPPLYFGRMKNVNREGPAVLGGIPEPKHLSVREIVSTEGTILDTRDKYAYMNAHLKGSLLTTLDNNFNTIAGSYADPDDELFLIIEESDLEEAVRDLIRVGLDHIAGYATPKELDRYEGELESIPAIDFDDAEQLRTDEDRKVLDVRKSAEYGRGSIPGSINIAHTRLAAQLDELPKEKELLVHCAGGQRASYASALLARNGFRVCWIDDSFSDWKEKYSEASGRSASH